jgi:CHAT domain-containing protein
MDTEAGRPHITWCATGPLSFLPIHAAGIYGDGTLSHSENAFDSIISSYAPSLTALIALHLKRTRLGAPIHPHPDRIPHILVVSQPKTPGQPPLPCTSTEAAEVRKHFPEGVTDLDDTRATVASVLREIPQHVWVHLACHGIQDPTDPTKSAFCLHDGRLDLAQLMGISHKGAELAVLSACQTAMGDNNLPDEAVHLASGMLAAGYRSVVATMWSIADEDGPVIADTLYAGLKRDLAGKEALRVADALHEAVDQLKRRVGEKNFWRWVPFVHFGL